MAAEPPKEQEAAQAPSSEEKISEEDAAAIAAALGEGETAAKSLKCLDCGKLFKNVDLANYHAEKSGHENFEESTEEVSWTCLWF
jgi:UBX domain-containing protein 1/4